MFRRISYSFPVQLLVNHFKRNHILILYWLILFAAVTYNFGSVLGIPFLFLDPEYLGRIDFRSFFIVGFVIGLFTMSFHITSYVIDGPRFRFLGVLEKPFTKFCINNSIIPIGFLAVYTVNMIQFQLQNEFGTVTGVLIEVAGFYAGFLTITGLMFWYFRTTNKDIFRVISNQVNKQMKKSVLARSNIMQRYRYDRLLEIRIDSYFNEWLAFRRITDLEKFFAKNDRDMIVKVFDQNHLNTVLIELSILAILFLTGFFREISYFQIPAAASAVLLLTFFVIFSGAISFWFRKWGFSISLVILLFFNYAITSDYLFSEYRAFGLNYSSERAELNLKTVSDHNSEFNVSSDKAETIEILSNWRNKFSEEKPKLILMGVSGGGQRSALWAFNALSALDSASKGQFFENTFLITGASGGLVGTAYFRELFLRRKQGLINEMDYKNYLKNISDDILNPIMFTLIVNDLFIKHQTFEYCDIEYFKDRGYAFEEQLNQNTDFVLDKKLMDYKMPEYNSEIPMLILSPTVINGGRKLYISPQHVSYLNITENGGDRTAGIDFLRFFEDQGSHNLRYLTALRMNATFPYITPNISLPTEPRVEIMDAGISDNFGIADAVQFLYNFREWISENTSGVIILSIRDSDKRQEFGGVDRQTIIQKFFTPIKSIYNNWWSFQGLNNETRVQYARSWFDGEITQINLQYTNNKPDGTPASMADEKYGKNRRASLNWHLTSKEKQDIISDIYSSENQESINRLVRLIVRDSVKQD